MVEEVHIQENVSDHYIFGNNNNFMSDLNQKKMCTIIFKFSCLYVVCRYCL